VTRRLADPYSLAHFLILPEMGLSLGFTVRIEQSSSI
jgi:hypothetical protein